MSGAPPLGASGGADTRPHLDVSARRAELTPGRPAVYWRGGWITYGELNDHASRLAGRLHVTGVRHGDRVGILAHNHPAHLYLLLATGKTGVVFTPFNVRLSAREQAAIAADLRPSVLLHDAAHAEAAGEAASTVDAETVAIEELDTWIGDPPPAPAAELDPEDPQMILLTGGTTGLPKGAVQPFRQGLANVANTVISWGLRDDDVVVQATPCYHAAINVLTVPLLHLGGRVALMERFEPDAYLDLVEEVGATALFLVPTMYRMLLDTPRFADADLTRVRWAISGGAPCPDPIRGAFAEKRVRFKQGYGLTEAGVNCFAISLSDAEHHPDAVGEPVLYGRAQVRREDGTPCEANEVGELTLAGPHVFSGYFGRPEATAEVLRDGWLWTGDLASCDEAGRYRIVGRRKEMFISGGENVFPAEIEATLHDHPAIAACAVVGVPDPRWGEVGLAVLVPRAKGQLSEASLRAWLGERLARFKVPKHVWMRASLPLSGAGKVLKNELRAEFLREERDAS